MAGRKSSKSLKGGSGKKRKKGKKKGLSKAKLAALRAFVELETLELIGSDGVIESLVPRFRANRFFYRNRLPFDSDLGLHELTLRATARDLHSKVLIEAWVPPAPIVGADAAPAPSKAGVAKKGSAPKPGASTTAAAAAKAKVNSAEAKAATAAKAAAAAKGKSKATDVKAALALDSIPEHLEPHIGHAKLVPPLVAADTSLSVAAAEDAGAPVAEPGSVAGDAAANSPTAMLAEQALPAHLLSIVRAEAGRLYDALRPLSLDPAARLSREGLYALLHGLRVGVGRAEAEALFALAARTGGGAAGGVGAAQLEAALAVCKPNCVQAQVHVGSAAAARHVDAFAQPLPPAAHAAGSARAQPSGQQQQQQQQQQNDGEGGGSERSEDEQPPATELLASAGSGPGAVVTASAQPQQPPGQHADVQGQQGDAQQEGEEGALTSLVRITVSSSCGTVCCRYLLELRCERPPPTPPLPAELLPAVRALFDFAAAPPPPPPSVPGTVSGPAAAAQPHAGPERLVSLESFVACMRSTHLSASAADARAAFLQANRQKERALLGPSQFWAALYLAFARANAADGSLEGSAGAVLERIRDAVLPLAWNRELCAVAARNRAAAVAAQRAEEDGRADQGRAQLHGDRWVFAPAKARGRALEQVGRGGGNVRESVAPATFPLAPEQQAAAVPAPVAASGTKRAARAAAAAAAYAAAEVEKRQAYLAHMQKVWTEQQSVQSMWPV